MKYRNVHSDQCGSVHLFVSSVHRMCFFFFYFIVTLFVPINKYIFYVRQTENGRSEDHLGGIRAKIRMAVSVSFSSLLFLFSVCIRAKRHQYLNLNVHNNNCFCNVPVHERTRAVFTLAHRRTSIVQVRLKQSAYVRTLILITFYKIIIIFDFHF